MSSSSDEDEGTVERLADGSRCPFILETSSTDLQEETEHECAPFFQTNFSASQLADLRDMGLLVNGNKFTLLRHKHEAYLKRPYISPLRASFVSLDSSRPWILYWTLHGLDLLDALPMEALERVVSTLQACWQDVDVQFTQNQLSANPFMKMKSGDKIKAGGFGGGPGQMAHCATTYAAVMTLCIIAGTSGDASVKAMELLQQIRLPLHAWFLSLQKEDGGYRMHLDGEVDVRATYTIFAVASLLNILTDALLGMVDKPSSVIQHVLHCQTYEGGFGGEPGSEAHGGYTFCAVAALALSGNLSQCDLPTLKSWLAHRQMSYEGGFSGRSNKLVDGCYSFWQGGGMTIVSLQQETGHKYNPQQDQWLQSPTQQQDLLFNEAPLQRYILLCAQDLNGGLRDKPSKPRDFYHSCYNLSGLSVSQTWGSRQFGLADLNRVHPLFNLRQERVQTAVKKFYSE